MIISKVFCFFFLADKQYKMIWQFGKEVDSGLSHATPLQKKNPVFKASQPIQSVIWQQA